MPLEPQLGGGGYAVRLQWRLSQALQRIRALTSCLVCRRQWRPWPQWNVRSGQFHYSVERILAFWSHAQYSNAKVRLTRKCFCAWPWWCSFSPATSALRGASISFTQRFYDNFLGMCVIESSDLVVGPQWDRIAIAEVP